MAEQYRMFKVIEYGNTVDTYHVEARNIHEAEERVKNEEGKRVDTDSSHDFFETSKIGHRVSLVQRVGSHSKKHVTFDKPSRTLVYGSANDVMKHILENPAGKHGTSYFYEISEHGDGESIELECIVIEEADIYGNT